MRTVTFYSYKGGTGRSLLLANLAVLVTRLGKRVVTLDLDLEAPGLHYKLLAGQPTPSTGAVDWLTARRAGRPVPSLHELALPVQVPEPLIADGSLTLVPAGRAPSGDYFQLVQDLHLDEWLLADGVDAFVDLVAAIKQELTPDYLFIDSRKGVTASNAVTTRVLADAVVVLTLDSLEQLEGTRAVLRTLQPLTSLQTGEAIDLHVVHGRSVDDDRALARICSYLGEPGWLAGSTVSIPAGHCHSVRHDPDVAKEEFLPMARVDPHPGPLHADYLAVARSLLPDLMNIDRLAQIIYGLDPDAVSPAARFLGFDSVAMDRRMPAGRGTESSDSLHERIRRLAALPETVQNLTDLAMALESEARGFADLGLATSARDASRREVSVWRQLYGRAPSDDVRKGLASALYRFSAYLTSTGERGQALTAVREAVALRRALAETNPAAFTPGLATSLNNLSNCLAEIGDRDAALTAVREAVTLYRTLGETNPAAFTPDLATSLNNLSNCLADTGDREAALTAIREAVTLYRTLGETNPAAFTSNLATSLNNLSNRLADTGDREAALTAIREAVTLRRALAEANPAAFTPDLATSLNNLSNCLADIGDRDAALTAIREAVTLRRALAEANPAAFTPDLAMSLNNLSNCLADTGDREEALTAIREATDLYRTLAETNPAAFTPDLATSLNNLSNRLADTGDHDAALTAIRQAVSLHRALAETNPAAFTPDLATSLNNLSNRLADIGDREAALTAIREATALYQQLADTYPVAFGKDLARSRKILGKLLRDDSE